MGVTRASKYSADHFWEDILFHVHPTTNNCTNPVALPLSESLSTGNVTGCLLGNATPEDADLLLTPASSDTYGAVTYNFDSFQPILNISFNFTISSPSSGDGADATFFYFNSSEDALTEDANISGYLVGFSEFHGLITVKYNSDNILISEEDMPGISYEFIPDTIYNINITFNAGDFNIYINSTLIASCTDDNYNTRSQDSNHVKFGVGARCGADYAQHVVAELNIMNIIATPLAGPKFLWDARLPQTVYLESDNSCTTWVDYYNSINLNLIFGHDVTKAPIYQIAGLNSQPTLTFNGVNNYLAHDFISESDLNFTFILVLGNLSTNLADNNGMVIQFNTDSSIWNVVYFNIEDIPQLGISAADTPLGAFLTQDGGQTIILQSTGDGTTANAWVNGGIKSTQTISIINGIGNLQIGSAVGNNYLDGSISFIAYYDSALSDSDLNSVLDYINNNFGIPFTPILES